MANQKTGVTSTPKAGGMTPFTALRRGSVGRTTAIQGKSVILVLGYHDKTTRQSMAKEKMFNEMSKTEASGCTQGSVAASSSMLEVVVDA